MGKSRQKTMRDFLDCERKRLLRELAMKEDGCSAENAGDSFTKKEEAVMAYYEMERRSANSLKLKERLIEIEHALDKMDNGTYGLCDCCGSRISLDRLKALPHTIYCVRCKLSREGQ